MSRLIRFLIIALFCFSFAARADNFSGPVLDKKKVEQACLEYVLRNTGYEQEKMILSLRNPLPDTFLPEGDLVLLVSGEIKKAAPVRTALKVEVKVRGQTIAVLHPVFDLDLKTKAFITTGWIKRGQAFSPADVSEVETRLSEMPAQAVTDLRQLQGVLAKVSLPKGRVLCLNHLAEPYLVEKKKPVKIVYSQKGLDIEARGIAMSNGTEGAVIRVRNMDSKKVIYAQVIGKDLVAVKVP